MLVYRRVFSQMVVKNGDESHGTIRKQVNKSKPSKMDLVRFFKSKTNGIFGKPISPIWINNINISVASHLDLHQKKSKACQLLANAIPQKNGSNEIPPKAPQEFQKRSLGHLLTCVFFFFGTETNTGWWFQPI